MSEKALMASESMVTKVAKILNQAERAEEGSPERDAFMEKAMQLSQAYAIDLAVARAHQAKSEKREEPERRTFQVGEQRDRMKNKNAHFVDLMLAICAANDIEVTISYSNVYVHGWGMPSDLDMAERLFAILSVQMVQEADAGLKRGDHGELRMVQKTRLEEIPEDERAWGEHDGSNNYTQRSYYDERDEFLIGDEKNGFKRRREVERGYNYSRFEVEYVNSYPPPKTRKVPVFEADGITPVMEERIVPVTPAVVWRANFYQGFIMRTRMRLAEARKQALQDAGVDMADEGDSKALALRDKRKDVREAFEEAERYVLSTGRTYGGAQVNSYSHVGHSAGDAAGQRARLGNEKDLGDG